MATDAPAKAERARWATPSRELRATIWDACGGRCHYCGCEVHPFRNFQVDHVIPRQHGGTDDVTNLVGACAMCNQRKGARLTFDPNEPKQARPATRQPAVISRRETGKGDVPATIRKRNALATFRQWRERRALMMAELTRLSGVTKTTIIAIEHGRVTAIKRRTIRRFAEALSVEPWDVLEFRRELSGDAPADDE